MSLPSISTSRLLSTTSRSREGLSKDGLDDFRSQDRVEAKEERLSQSSVFSQGEFQTFERHDRRRSDVPPSAVLSPISPSDHDATPRSEHPPHHSVLASSTKSSLSSPRHALTRQKTVKPSGTGESNIFASTGNQSLGAPLTSSDLVDNVIDCSATTSEAGRQIFSHGPMTSSGAKGPKGISIDSDGYTAQDGLTERLGGLQSPVSPLTNEVASFISQEASANGIHVGYQDSQIASNSWNDATNPDAADAGRRMSFSARPWLGSRTSSSTIDIPIESIAQMDDEDSTGTREERVSSNASYFPDVEELKRTGVIGEDRQTGASVESSRELAITGDEQRAGFPSQPASAGNTASQSLSRPGLEITTPDSTDSPRNASNTHTGSWPCSKKHGDTPFGMSRVMALANSLCLDQSSNADSRRDESLLGDKASPRRMDVGNLKSLGFNAAEDSISPKSQLPPVLVPGKQDQFPAQHRRSAPSFKGQSLSGLSPMGKQASLTASTSRSTEDALLESWGFTVSTPLCPPKCYPLSSPALNSAPKERFCRAVSSAASLSSSSSGRIPSSAPPGLDTRRRFSSSTPPALLRAGNRSASMAASLDHRPILGSAHGLGGGTQSQDEPLRTGSQLTGNSPSFTSSRPSSLRSGHGSDSSGSDGVSSRSNTRASSRQDSGASSDYLAMTADWRRSSSMTAQSTGTRASQSSGVFSMEDNEQDEQLLHPSADLEQTSEGPAAQLDPEAFGAPVAQDLPSQEDHEDDTHIIPYEGVVNIIPYEDRYVISAIMEGFTIDNITVAVKSVKNGIPGGVLDDTSSIKSAGSSVSSRSSFTAGNKTRKTKCVHLVADRWEDGGESAHCAARRSTNPSCSAFRAENRVWNRCRLFQGDHCAL